MYTFFSLFQLILYHSVGSLFVLFYTGKNTDNPVSLFPPQLSGVYGPIRPLFIVVSLLVTPYKVGYRSPREKGREKLEDSHTGSSFGWSLGHPFFFGVFTSTSQLGTSRLVSSLLHLLPRL